VSGDPAITLNCGSGTTYPKTCTAPFIGIGVRVILTVGCNTGLGAGACANAIGYTFNYGDGTTETTTSSSVDHVFRAPGEYVITATVQTNTGASGSQRLTLIVIR
jgi:PKD repeat protein